MNDKELYKKAIILTDSCNQIKLIERIVENLAYATCKNDMDSIHYHAKSGTFSEISDNLEMIRRTVQEVSNDICPD